MMLEIDYYYDLDTIYHDFIKTRHISELKNIFPPGNRYSYFPVDFKMYNYLSDNCDGYDVS